MWFQTFRLDSVSFNIKAALTENEIQFLEKKLFSSFIFYEMFSFDLKQLDFISIQNWNAICKSGDPNLGDAPPGGTREVSNSDSWVHLFHGGGGRRHRKVWNPCNKVLFN